MPVKSQFRIDVEAACKVAGVKLNVDRPVYNDVYRSGTRRIKFCGVQSTPEQRNVIACELLFKQHHNVIVGTTTNKRSTSFYQQSNYHRGLTVQFPA